MGETLQEYKSRSNNMPGMFSVIDIRIDNYTSLMSTDVDGLEIISEIYHNI